MVSTRALLLLSLLATSCGDGDAKNSDALPAREQLFDAKNCRNCHSSHYDEWSASMHAYSSRDPVFLAMNRRGQEETDGALGDFCVRCHAPLAVREGLTTDGLNLESLPEAMHGVGCYTCHNVAAVEGQHNNPLVGRDDHTMLGRIEDPRPSSFHDSEYSPLLAGDQAESASLCGSCHDVVLPPPVELHLERTHLEWQSSVFAPKNAPQPSAVSTCSGCHLRGERGPVAVGGPARVRHLHHMAGVDAPLEPFPSTADAQQDERLAAQQRQELQKSLDSTLRIEICVQLVPGNRSAVQVTIDNASAGHDFPSGVAHDRRAWVELTASHEGAVLYQSGGVAEGQAVTEAALEDRDQWLFRDEVKNAQGEAAHMFWDIAELTPRTIPVQVTSDQSDPRYYLSHAFRRFPRDPAQLIEGSPDVVTVRVRIRPVDFDVIDDLITSGHLEDRFRSEIPTFDLLPFRQLSAPALESLQTVSMEWSAATLGSPLFSVRQDATVNPPLSCVAMPRRGR
jgi:hypothetical protein